MTMLQPDSVFTFGKYKGKTVFEVFTTNPSYLCWMRKTGFSNFGKEVTEAIFAWEELNPKEVEKVERGIKASLARGQFPRHQSKNETAQPIVEISSSKISRSLSDPLFGSW